MSHFDLCCHGKKIRKVNHAFLLLIIYCAAVTVAVLASCVVGDGGNFKDSKKDNLLYLILFYMFVTL